MLFNKKILVLLFAAILLAGCGPRGSEETPQDVLVNQEYLKRKVKDFTGSDAQFILRGKFASDSTTEFSSGIEVISKKEWGIKFFLFDTRDSVKKVFESKLLDGSFKDCKVEKVRFNNSDHDFLYYNSMNYFMGSGGGEVIAYIIDLKSQMVYYSHLVAEPEGKVELYMSHQDNSEISNFLVSTFKKDYPALKLTSKDPVLN